jgi:hypothetical protein
MWVATGNNKVELAGAAWLTECRNVFDGQMTCCTKEHVFDDVVQGVCRASPARLSRSAG